MAMTDNEKYSAVLRELGELLENKNTTISSQNWQIEQLKEKLAVAENELHFAKERLAGAHVAIDALQAELYEMKGDTAKC